MVLFLQCVAEAVAEHGLRGLAGVIPGGGAMFDIAAAVWQKYRERRNHAEQREEIQRLAEASNAEVKRAAEEAARKAAANQPEVLPALELFLTQIPATIRQSLKRSDDPSGKTVPPGFALRGPEDVAKLLPQALPRFRAGDALPGKAGWVLDRPLGVGGFGEVWLARHPQFQSLRGAVKFCRHLEMSDREMLHEGKLIDRLLAQGSHPNIVRLLDVNLEGDAPWLMYEYADGGDLADRIHHWAALPPADRQEQAVAALRELAAAVGHFHRLQPAIVHRDLKPANILLDGTGRLRITDFGIGGIAARHMIDEQTRHSATRTGRLLSCLAGSYTPLYASPQQRDGEAPDPRDDVHALGVIGYQMLTGQLGQGVGPDFAEDLLETGVVPDLVDLLRRCTAQRIDRRPRDAAEVAAALAALPTRKAAATVPVAVPVVAPVPVVQPAPVEVYPVKPPPVPAEDASPRGGWTDALREILDDPIQKVAFIQQSRSFLKVLKTTEKNIEDTRVLSIILPTLFGTGVVVAIAVPTSVTGALSILVAVTLGLLGGAVVSGALLLLLWVICRMQKAKQDAAVETYAVAFPELADHCGGTARLRNQDFIRSILDSVDDLPKPGFFERLLGG
jgi:serine/threonine protein kinase